MNVIARSAVAAALIVVFVLGGCGGVEKTDDEPITKTVEPYRVIARLRFDVGRVRLIMKPRYRVEEPEGTEKLRETVERHMRLRFAAVGILGGLTNEVLDLYLTANDRSYDAGLVFVTRIEGVPDFETELLAEIAIKGAPTFDALIDRFEAKLQRATGPELYRRFKPVIVKPE